jgi:ABC-type branched-subunit amino acid transport system substrate-binding protein
LLTAGANLVLNAAPIEPGWENNDCVRLQFAALSAAFLCAATTGTALAQRKYDTGASDTEIRIGNIMPYSGPASAYGVIGKTEEAYFNKINVEGGINGRKIEQLQMMRFKGKS